MKKNRRIRDTDPRLADAVFIATASQPMPDPTPPRETRQPKKSRTPRSTAKHRQATPAKKAHRESEKAPAKPLRVISVRQPWAELLVTGVKRFEVRTWSPPSTGVILVHASAGKAHDMPGLRSQTWFQNALREAEMKDEATWQQSAIIGAVEIKRIWEPGAPPARLTQKDVYLCGATDWVYLWEVGRRWPFSKPIRCDGKLNLWKLPPELMGDVKVQLELSGVPSDASFA